MPIVLKLKEALAQREVTVYRLGEESGIARNTLYNMVNKPRERVDLTVLDKVILALEHITSKPVELTDLLERQPDPEPKDQTTVEDLALLEADLGGLGRYGPYDFGAAGEPEGQPVKYVKGEGLYIETDPSAA